MTGPEGMKITYDDVGAAPPKFGLFRDLTKVRRVGLILEHEPLLKDTALRGLLDV